MVPDRDVRVSVKALALSCVGAAVALCPESFFSQLYTAPLDAAECPGTVPPPASTSARARRSLEDGSPPRLLWGRTAGSCVRGLRP